MNKVKMEGEDGSYPLVDTSTGRDVRIRQYPFDIPGIDFYYKILDSNEIEVYVRGTPSDYVMSYSLSLSLVYSLFSSPSFLHHY
jgi:hypothetical protein